jgi:hypothetical protein
MGVKVIKRHRPAEKTSLIGVASVPEEKILLRFHSLVNVQLVQRQPYEFFSNGAGSPC